MTNNCMNWIELVNFKSYKYCKLSFSQLTCIIGTNGSGKSNIMDAISFVLGMNSKSLRSNNMRELVMIGCSECSVKLSLTSNTSNTVELYKCVTSSGTSECRINNSRVSVKEYECYLCNECNIIVKCKNCLVFQNDVININDDVISTVELISGSAQLKSEYEELEQVMNRQLEELTVVYNNKKQLTLEMKQYNQILDITKQYKDKNKQLLLHKQQLLLLELYINQHTTHRHSLALNECVLLENDTSNLLDIRRKLNKIKSKCLLIDNKLSAKQKIVNTFKLQQFELTEKLNLVQQSSHIVDKYTDKLSTCTITIQQLTNQYTQLSSIQLSTHSLVLLPTQITEFNHLLLTFNKNTSNLNSITLQQQSLSKQLQSLTNTNLPHLSTLLSTLDSTILQHSEHSTTLTTTLSVLTHEYTKLLHSHSTLSTRIDSSNIKLSTTLNTLIGFKQYIKTNRHTTQLNNAIKHLSTLYSGVYGKVANLFSVKHAKYSTAILLVLSKHSNSIVVKDTNTAIECINYLKEQQIHICTFIPLDVTYTHQLDKYKSFCKGAFMCIDLLEFDVKFTNVFNYVTNQSIVTDSVDISKYICFEKEQTVKCVSVDGIIIHKNKCMSGGSSLGESTFDVAMVEKCKELKVQLVDQIKSDSRELVALDTAIVQKQLLLNDTQDTLDRISSVLDELVKKRDSLLLEIRHEQRQAEMCKVKRAELELQLQLIKSQMVEIESVIDAERVNVFTDFCTRLGIEDIKEFVRDQTCLLRTRSEKENSIKSQMCKLKSQIQFEEKQSRELELKISTERAAMEEQERIRLELELELKKVKTEKSAVMSEIQGLQVKNHEWKLKVDALAAQLEEEKQRLAVIQQQNDTITRQIQEWETLLVKCSEEKYMLFRKSKLEQIPLPLIHGTLDDVMDSMLQLDDSTQRIENSVGIDFSVLNDLYQSDEPSLHLPILVQELNELQDEINALAPSLQSTFAFDTVPSRLKQTEKAFLIAKQKTKVARDRFNSIKQERLKRFNDAFNHISTQIDPIYKSLTATRSFPHGGSAFLSLDNPQLPFDGGVKFHAMPPMKRFHSLASLSGGEKTISALALLLAIQSYKPAPFFIVDEIDAALDPVNVGKVARWMREFSRGCQVVVISLKMGVWMWGEKVVGVYKKEGESRCVWVDMGEYE